MLLALTDSTLAFLSLFKLRRFLADDVVDMVLLLPRSLDHREELLLLFLVSELARLAFALHLVLHDGLFGGVVLLSAGILEAFLLSAPLDAAHDQDDDEDEY